MKMKLVEAISKVSEEDFKLAVDRWLSGFNSEGYDRKLYLNS